MTIRPEDDVKPSLLGKLVGAVVLVVELETWVVGAFVDVSASLVGEIVNVWASVVKVVGTDMLGSDTVSPPITTTLGGELPVIVNVWPSVVRVVGTETLGSDNVLPPPQPHLREAACTGCLFG